MRPRDTDPAAQRLLDEHYRRMSPMEKVELVRDAWRTVRGLQLVGLRELHPLASEDELEEMLAERWLGTALFRRVRAWQEERLRAR